jgi:hypothetical protein
MVDSVGIECMDDSIAKRKPQRDVTRRNVI